MWGMIWNTFAVIGAVSSALVVGIYAGCATSGIINRRKAGAPPDVPPDV